MKKLFRRGLKPSAGLVTLCLLAASAYGSAVPRPEARRAQANREAQGVPLAVGIPFEGRLADGEVEVFRLELPDDTYLRLEIEPRSIDLDVRLHAPGGELLAEVWSRTGRPSPRFLAALTPVAGSHELRIRASSKLAGAHDFALVVTEQRPAGSGDAVRAAAARLLSEGFRLSEEGTTEAGEAALESFKEMLELYLELTDPVGRATALYWIGLVLGDLHRHAETLEPFEAALELWRQLEQKDRQAELLYRIGIGHHKTGQLPAALDSLRRTVTLRQELGDRQGEALSHNNLSAVFQQLNQLQLALDHSRRARELFHELGQAAREARELLNLARIYQQLGDLERGLDRLYEAQPILRAAGDHHSEAVVLNNIGWTHRKQREPRKGLELFQQALAVAVEHDYGALQAVFLNNAGRALLDLGRPAEALRDLEHALELSHRYGSPRDECVRLISISAALQALGEHEQAATRLAEALASSRRHGYRNEEAGALFELARTHRTQGRLATALLEVEAALAIVEEVRTDLDSHNLKASFSAYRIPYHELRVDLLMQHALTWPEAGFDALALAAHEQARGRGLLETLAEAGTELRTSAPPELLEEERRLHERLNARALARSRLLADGRPGELVAVEKEIRHLVGRLDDVAGRIRKASPRYAALVRPRQLDLRTLRSRVLDEDSMLLEIALGEERSFLWTVTTDSLQAFVLPPRARIEAVARRVYELLSDGEAWRGADSWSHGLRYRRAAAELSELVLAPAAGQLAGRRLLVVADGALLYIPFAALPAPGGGPRPLVLDHEIVSLPSASVLAFQRRERAARPPAPKLLAILADPVYQPADDRVVGSGAALADPRLAAGFDPTFVQRSARAAGLEQLVRLPYSHREAEAIAGLVPPEASRLVLGFDANLRFATRELENFRWLHFATHGVFNSRTPELSGLVLSLVDRQGRPRDGFLRLHDIYNLRLNAELVVLSGCQTALGKEIRGEGLIGLTRGFLHAGAQRVVASLWRVEDQATADLVERFYRGMLEQGLRPAAALRQAQIEMLEGPSRRWRAPYAWAAFVLQGEWR